MSVHDAPLLKRIYRARQAATIPNELRPCGLLLGRREMEELERLKGEFPAAPDRATVPDDVQLTIYALPVRPVDEDERLSVETEEFVWIPIDVPGCLEKGWRKSRPFAKET